MANNQPLSPQDSNSFPFPSEFLKICTSNAKRSLIGSFIFWFNYSQSWPSFHTFDRIFNKKIEFTFWVLVP